jgi:hypothetical protein
VQAEKRNSLADLTMSIHTDPTLLGAARAAEMLPELAQEG